MGVVLSARSCSCYASAPAAQRLKAQLFNFFRLLWLALLAQGTNSIINSYIPVVAAGPGVSVCLALYNAVANVGGLFGPWVIGE